MVKELDILRTKLQVLRDNPGAAEESEGGLDSVRLRCEARET